MKNLKFNKRQSGFYRVNSRRSENCDALIANIKSVYLKNRDSLSLQDLQKLLEMARTIEIHKKVLPDYERDIMYKNLEKIRSRCAKYR